MNQKPESFDPPTMTYRPAIIIALFSASLFVVGCSNKPKPGQTQAMANTEEKKAAAGAENSVEKAAEAGGGIFDGLADFAKKIAGDTPDKYAKYTLSESADDRRIGINGLVERDYGRKPPYTDRYLDMAKGDPDPLVRAVAIRALNQSRDKRVTEVATKGLTDANGVVRLESAKALNRVPDESAVQPLLSVMNNPAEEKDIRIAAAEALRHYKRLEVARSLVSNLSSRDFGLAFQSRRSLKNLFGRDLLYNEAAWLSFLTGPDKPFG